jgi:hypothetical protein
MAAPLGSQGCIVTENVPCRALMAVGHGERSLSGCYGCCVKKHKLHQIMGAKLTGECTEKCGCARARTHTHTHTHTHTGAANVGDFLALQPLLGFHREPEDAGEIVFSSDRTSKGGGVEVEGVIQSGCPGCGRGPPHPS